jgi:arginyl-tRNA synthetase
MTLFHQLRADLSAIVKVLFPEAGAVFFVVEPCKDPKHGDVATNIAMILAGGMKKNPRDVAAAFLPSLNDLPYIAQADVAGPGFINLRVTTQFWQEELRRIDQAGPRYGAQNLGQGMPVIVEYVSANPTGPMHVGHVRGGVFGDVLARLFTVMGYDVTKEYYINDAGAQIDVLARSLYHRYRQVYDPAVGDVPAGLYPGEYVIDAARALRDQDGDCWLSVGEDVWLPAFRNKAVSAMMAEIRDDLDVLGIGFDRFTSEASLQSRIPEVLERLEAMGHIGMGTLPPPKGQEDEDWHPRPQRLFFSTRFGDDVDRALQKQDGSWTYFASDLAYHADKIQRGAGLLINVLGADHGGYVKRLSAAVQALSRGDVVLTVKLCQMVALKKNGEELKMSKRAGTFVTARDVTDRVGKDVLRLMMLTRRNDVAFEFDMDRVFEQSKDNPVFYIQYAYARTCSIMRHALTTLDVTPEGLKTLMDQADLTRLLPEDQALIQTMALWPRTLELATVHQEPHRIVFYLMDLAHAFHHLWHLGSSQHALRFLASEDPATTAARLVLIAGMQNVLRSAFAILGVELRESM